MIQPSQAGLKGKEVRGLTDGVLHFGGHLLAFLFQLCYDVLAQLGIAPSSVRVCVCVCVCVRERERERERRGQMGLHKIWSSRNNVYS